MMATAAFRLTARRRWVRCKGSGLASGLELVFAETILFQLSVQGGFADAEKASGHQLVALEFPNGVEDRLLFKLGDGEDAGGLLVCLA